MSTYGPDRGKGYRHTNESLGQGRGFDEMADDHMRASPNEPLIKDHLDAETIVDMSRFSEPGVEGGETDDGQLLEPDFTYAQQYSHVEPTPAFGKPVGASDRPAADPREPGPSAWTPEHDRGLCEDGASVIDADEVDDKEYENYDPAGFDAIEPQPYLTWIEETILGEWAERQRNAEHAIVLTDAHGRIAADGFADRPQPDGRKDRADTTEADEPSLAAEVATASRVADLAETLGCSLPVARDKLVALAGMGATDETEIEPTSTAGTEAATSEPELEPDLGPAATADGAAAAIANGGAAGADAPVNAVFPAPTVDHREGYSRAASAHRQPIRHATDAYHAPARTVGYRDSVPTLLSDAAADQATPTNPRDQLDVAQREAVEDEAARLHEQYPFFATDTAAVAIATQLIRHDSSVLEAVLAVTDELAAWTGITPIGQLDPDDPPERPYEQPQATIQGTVTMLYEPADVSQQQVGIIDDGTGTVKLTVWEKSGIDTVLHEGDTVRVMDGVIDTYKGQPTIAAVGEEDHLPFSARSHRGSRLMVVEQGDGPAPIHGLHYQVDWASGVGFPGEQRLKHGPATGDGGDLNADDAAVDPRAELEQPTLAAVNQAAHRLATESDLDAPRAVISRVLAKRVAGDADTDVDEALMAVLTQPRLVENDPAETDADADDGTGEALPDPSLSRVTPAERQDEPVAHPDSATKFTIETPFDACTWLYADETYPEPDAWPIYHRETDQYGNLEAIVQAGMLTLPAETPTHVERERPAAPSAGTTTEAADDTAAFQYTTTARCPQCGEAVDANVEIKQLRAADEAGTRIFTGACGHTWRGDD